MFGGGEEERWDFRLPTANSRVFPYPPQCLPPPPFCPALPKGKGLKELGLERERTGEVKVWSLRSRVVPGHKQRRGRRQRGAEHADRLRYLVSRFADVRPIPSDTPFEKPRAAVAGVDPVVFARAAVAAHFTGDI